ncbi:hypothetical protein Cni_G13632 [Canna indica]|uniref:Pentatricopeptide repeat-containing protein n=1 Tax=Canna indica TaxID=4628 RepID=A0AAQ3KBJ3_9LILI|nr:hypothetical protein Cni_G13632 [Canna indica]
MRTTFRFRLLSLKRSFCSSITTTASNAAVNTNPSPRSFTEPLLVTIDKLFKQHDADKLTSDFIAASESYRFRCRHRVYEVVVRRLAQYGRGDAVEAILEAQKRFLSNFTREGFGVRLIALYGKAAMPAHAAATFRQLPALGSPRTVKSFNALLTAYAESADFDGLNASFREIPAADPSITPDLISYNILVRALCQKGDLDAALGTVDLMETNGMCPNLITFNTLLFSFYEKNGCADAEKIWTLMREKNIEPDTKSFNAKLRGLVLEGRIPEVAELIDQMKRVGPKPDASSYNALIKGYLQDGNLEAAKMLFADFTKNECPPNRSTFEILIPSLCETTDLDLALKCCYDSMSRRCFVRAALLQRVVDELVKSSRIEEANKLVDIGRQNNYSRKSLHMP